MSTGSEFIANLERSSDACDSFVNDVDPVATHAGVVKESLDGIATAIAEDVVPAINMATDESGELNTHTTAAVQSAGKMHNTVTHTLRSTNNPSAMAAIDMADKVKILTVEGAPGDMETLAAAAVDKLGDIAIMAVQLQEAVDEARTLYNLLKERALMAQQAGTTGGEEVRRYTAEVRRMLGGGA